MVSDSLVRNIAIFIGATLFATVGLLCLFRPAAVRDFAVRNTPKKIGPVSNPVWDWMQTSQYVWSLRVVGVLAMCGLIALLAVAIRGK